jgi:PPK2 family polyphosphate:nucleotide phosphotransferase
MDPYRVRPEHSIPWSEWNADDQREFTGNKKSAEAKTQSLLEDLDRLQELLYAEHKHKMLIVLQGMDTAGKDGTIRHVFRGMNPAGVRIASFKVPTPEELAHDFLWRIHQQTPGAGEIVIFNRSHYEDVLVVRVHGMISRPECRRRYAAINAFEKILAEEGTEILKFYLNIDKTEQKKRLEDRLAEKSKHWKFNPGDLKERAVWGDYMKAYEDAVTATSTAWAPWYVIPANRKWYRNLIVSKIIVQRLKDLKMAYPKSAPGLDQIVIED